MSKDCIPTPPGLLECVLRRIRKEERILFIRRSVLSSAVVVLMVFGAINVGFLDHDSGVASAPLPASKSFASPIDSTQNNNIAYSVQYTPQSQAPKTIFYTASSPNELFSGYDR